MPISISDKISGVCVYGVVVVVWGIVYVWGWKEGTERARRAKGPIWELGVKSARRLLLSVLPKPGGNSWVLQRQLGTEKEEKGLAGEAAMCTESTPYPLWSKYRLIETFKNFLSVRYLSIFYKEREDEREGAGEQSVRFPLEGCKSHGYELDRYLQAQPRQSRVIYKCYSSDLQRPVLEHSRCLEMYLIYSQGCTFALFTTSHLQGNVPPLN